VISHYSRLLHQTWLGWALAGGVPWLGPAFEILHFVGMALLFGYVAVFDLRLLGVAKGLPIRAIRRLAPWGLLGFIINLITGVGFYAGSPDQYQSLAFAAKVACIVLAGLNALLFRTSGLSARVEPVRAGEDAPFSAKTAALASLLLWTGVMFWGRMLQVFSNAF
jgi:hypothetical protein